MGLLDDAIREHLELKRRHGADPQEVARQEDEALGPIGGREPEREDAEPDAERAHEHDVPVLREPEPELDFELDEPPVPVEEPAAVHADQPELDLPPLAEEAAEEPAEPAEEPQADVHQPTIEYSIADVPEPAEPAEPAPGPAEEEPGEPADELEETPEFLQETPEHDRLWFEQKPPRDFDF